VQCWAKGQEISRSYQLWITHSPPHRKKDSLNLIYAHTQNLLTRNTAEFVEIPDCLSHFNLLPCLFNHRTSDRSRIDEGRREANSIDPNNKKRRCGEDKQKHDEKWQDNGVCVDVYGGGKAVVRKEKADRQRISEACHFFFFFFYCSCSSFFFLYLVEFAFIFTSCYFSCCASHIPVFFFLLVRDAHFRRGNECHLLAFYVFFLMIWQPFLFYFLESVVV
jgi:hypothetical protein